MCGNRFATGFEVKVLLRKTLTSNVKFEPILLIFFHPIFLSESEFDRSEARNEVSESIDMILGFISIRTTLRKNKLIINQ